MSKHSRKKAKSMGGGKRAGARACPCGSESLYRDCCRPYHKGRNAEDPTTLLRTRFSAFALAEAAYLISTLHADHELAGLDTERARVALGLSSATRYRGLAVHERSPQLEDETEARVLFTALIYRGGQERSFMELSEFRRVHTLWQYLDGLVLPLERVVDVKSIAEFEAAAMTTPHDASEHRQDLRSAPAPDRANQGLHGVRQQPRRGAMAGPGGTGTD